MNVRRLQYLTALFFVLIMAATSSCNYYKHVPANDKLYVGASVSVTSDSGTVSKKQLKTLKKDLEGITRPRPNKSILGWKYKLAFYNMSGNIEKKKGLGNFIRKKLGEPPVLASTMNLQNNVDILNNRMENYGFFRVQSSGDTTIRGRNVKAKYDIDAGPQYTMQVINYDSGQAQLQKEIKAEQKNSFIQIDRPYNFELIKGERQRIADELKNRGYYYFDEDYIIAKVDTTEGQTGVAIYLSLKKTTPTLAQQAYTIKNVVLLPNFSIRSGDTNTNSLGKRYYNSFYVVDSANTFKPKTFEYSVMFDRGNLYSKKNHNLTLNRLINLGAFKFVKNKFELANEDSAQLNINYLLTPLARRSLSAEVVGNTKSNNLTGSNLTIGFKNRNLFRAAEQLSINLNGGFEIQVAGQQKGYYTYRFGGDVRLTIPRFIIPFSPKITTGSAYVPKTHFTAGYEIVNKAKLYTMQSLRGSYGYIWKEDIRKTHELNPISIVYAQPLKVTQLYTDSAVSNPTLLKAIEKQFILGTTYNYTYDGQIANYKKNLFYIDVGLDFSGNLAGLLTGANASDSEPQKIVGGVFSQYAKSQIDFRYYHKFNDKDMLANRIIIGGSLPYGNSRSLPYIKQFFSGGNNSLRAFRSRSVGPGTYNYTSENAQANFLADQSGDFKFEFNTEYRKHLAGPVHGALFFDAGNIWLYNEDSLRPGAKITRNWYNELAAGAGVGLRFDFSILVLRLDLAMPLRVPYLPEGERWVVDQIKFKDTEWRRQNLIFNLAIGYPF